jgi:transcription elongation factor GreA
MTTALAHLPPLLPEPGQVLLTEPGREVLCRRAVFLRTAVLPELSAGLTQRDRDRRVDAEYHRVLAQLAVLDELVSTAGSTRDRPRDGRIGVGDRVLVELPEHEQLEVLLCCEQEAALDDLRISIHSPLAKALVGARVGDTVPVLSPNGAYSARVLSVRRE